MRCLLQRAAFDGESVSCSSTLGTGDPILVATLPPPPAAFLSLAPTLCAVNFLQTSPDRPPITVMSRPHRLVGADVYDMLSKYDLIGVGVMLSPNPAGQVCVCVVVCYRVVAGEGVLYATSFRLKGYVNGGQALKVVIHLLHCQTIVVTGVGQTRIHSVRCRSFW